jgi:hypothetical protein
MVAIASRARATPVLHVNTFTQAVEEGVLASFGGFTLSLRVLLPSFFRVAAMGISSIAPKTLVLPYVRLF